MSRPRHRCLLFLLLSVLCSSPNYFTFFLVFFHIFLQFSFLHAFISCPARLFPVLSLSPIPMHLSGNSVHPPPPSSTSSPLGALLQWLCSSKSSLETLSPLPPVTVVFRPLLTHCHLSKHFHLNLHFHSASPVSQSTVGKDTECSLVKLRSP